MSNTSGAGLVVVAGATLRCSAGACPSVLGVVDSPLLAGGGRLVATSADAAAGLNIRPFGRCAFRDGPCVPAPASRWSGCTGRSVTGRGALLDAGATLLCRQGGVIRIAHPGQTSTVLRASGVPMMRQGR